MKWENHNYFLSWREPWHKFEDWDWFNGRNFCRDRCMDLVSFDTPEEFRIFAAIMKQGKLIGYFIQDQNSKFYQSEAFTKVIQFAQANTGLCKIKEKQTRNGLRLLITFEPVSTTKQALHALSKTNEQQSTF